MKGGKMSKGEEKMHKVMGEYKEGTLHSGSKEGPKVTNRKQAIAIGMSEARHTMGHGGKGGALRHVRST